MFKYALCHFTLLPPFFSSTTCPLNSLCISYQSKKIIEEEHLSTLLVYMFISVLLYSYMMSLLNLCTN
jgi:hypothetical protein